jgi:hypothetical protein
MNIETVPHSTDQNPGWRTSLVRLLTSLTILLLIIVPLIPSEMVHATGKDVTGWLILIILLIIPLSPILSIFKTIGYLLTGRLHFPTDRVGEKVTGEGGQEFTVFRKVVVDPGKGQPAQPGALLTLRFKVTNMTPGVNRFYSVLPLLLYIGDKGFRSKLFTINGDQCQSIYEWDTVQDAENYLQSLALKTILLRSVTGSFSCSIQPLTN